MKAKSLFMKLLNTRALTIAFVMIFLTGCGSSTATSSSVSSGDYSSSSSSSSSENSNTTLQGDSTLPSQVLSEYNPVDFSTVPENEESDFVYTEDGFVTTITGYTGASSQVKIPQNLGTLGNIKISQDAFKGNKQITEVYIPDTVTSIEEQAFRGCSSLKEVYTGGVRSIGLGAFMDCKALRRVEIGEGCVEIDGDIVKDGAFENCINLTDIVFPSTICAISADAFINCSNLERVDLSNTATVYIGQNAFSECIRLKSIVLPPTVESIESNAFLYCDMLSELDFPNGNEFCELVDGILYEDNILILGLGGYDNPDVVVREGTEQIETHAFQYNRVITSIKIPNSVTSIGRMAFNECINLSHVDFGNSIQSIGQGAFEHCISLTEVILPNSPMEIYSSAFYGCGPNLVKVVLPDQFSYWGVDGGTEDVFHFDENAVFTFRGKEYTFEQASELDAAIAEVNSGE